MPVRRATSITSIPGGTTTSRSLIFSVICFCSAMGLGSGHNFRGLVRALAAQVLFKLMPPFLHEADRGQRRGVAQRTECTPQHVLGQLVDQRDIFAAPAAFVEAVEHLAQPGRAFPTRNAPAA